MYVWQDSSLGDGDASHQLVEILVVPGKFTLVFIITKFKQRSPNCQLEMPGDDPGLLIVPRCPAGQLEDLGCQVLHDGRQVHRGSGSHSLGVVAFPNKDSLNATLIHTRPAT